MRGVRQDFKKGLFQPGFEAGQLKNTQTSILIEKVPIPKD